MVARNVSYRLFLYWKGYVKNHLARCSSYPMGGVSWDTSWGKLSMDGKSARKSEPLLFPGAAKSGLFYLLHGIHTYGKVFFLHQKVTVLSLPITRQVFYHGRNHFILQIICKSLTTCVINKEKQFPTIFIQQKQAQLSLVFDSGDNNGLSGSSSPRWKWLILPHPWPFSINDTR